ncbi:MAG: hypothetical protein BGO96_13130 [Micrococcales bacterium 73-15]|nr:MAG: hypothetical protein BGO96_13130 [Micrococcales bacterium 73-15]
MKETTTMSTTPRSLTPRRSAATGAVLVLVAALAACSNGDGGGSGGDLTYEDSPINSYFEAFNVMGDMSQEEQQAFYDERDRKTEDLVAQCMADQGFEYNPQSSRTTYVGSSNEDGPQWGTLEFAQQYGYGAFSWPGQEEMELQEPEEWVDPNQDIIDSMSESELTAWQEALWGAPQEWDEDADMEEYEWNWEDSGCYGWAQHELEADDPWTAMNSLYEDPRFAELFAQMGELYTKAESDPRMADLTGKWSSCMADAGYTFANPNEAQQSIYDLQNGLWEGHEDDPEYMGPSDEELAPIKEQELETAVADFTCQDELNYQQEQLSIQFKIEQEFVDANKDALEELSAAAQELQK